MLSAPQSQAAAATSLDRTTYECCGSPAFGSLSYPPRRRRGRGRRRVRFASAARAGWRPDSARAKAKYFRVWVCRAARPSNADAARWTGRTTGAESDRRPGRPVRYGLCMARVCQEVKSSSAGKASLFRRFRGSCSGCTLGIDLFWFALPPEQLTLRVRPRYYMGQRSRQAVSSPYPGPILDLTSHSTTAPSGTYPGFGMNVIADAAQTASRLVDALRVFELPVRMSGPTYPTRRVPPRIKFAAIATGSTRAAREYDFGWIHHAVTKLAKELHEASTRHYIGFRRFYAGAQLKWAKEPVRLELARHWGDPSPHALWGSGRIVGRARRSCGTLPTRNPGS